MPERTSQEHARCLRPRTLIKSSQVPNIVQDRSNVEEMKRLLVLDQLLTTGMGSVLPEQADLTIFRRVLDVGCGAGGWLREVAKTYPSISLLLGVDISDCQR